MNLSRRDGAVLQISDADQERFLMQEKGDDYRVPEYSGKLCYFGGGIEVDTLETLSLPELPYDALKREIGEEICLPEDSSLQLEDILERTTSWQRFRLQGEHINHGEPERYDFALYVYRCILENHLYQELMDVIKRPDVIQEGRAIPLTREELEAYAATEDAFIFSIEQVVRASFDDSPMGFLAETDPHESVCSVSENGIGSLP